MGGLVVPRSPLEKIALRKVGTGTGRGRPAPSGKEGQIKFGNFNKSKRWLLVR